MAYRGKSREGMGRRTLTERVLDRDGWTCQMPRCLAEEPGRQVNGGHGRKIERALTGTGGIWAASLDHIIPRSQGGRTVMDNLRAAHRKCNSIAAGKPLPELLGTGVKRGPAVGIILDDPEAVLGGRLPWPESAGAVRGPWGGIVTAASIAAPWVDPRHERADAEWKEHLRERWAVLAPDDDQESA